ncbi:hypothetical protein ACHQM5_018661 [Ranunculus cassubicifolius]
MLITATGNSNPNPNPNPNPNNEGIQCSLAACYRFNVVVKGTRYEGFGPNHKVQGIVTATYANGSRKRGVTWESVQITSLGKIETYTHGYLVEVRHEWINFIKDLSPLD